MTTTLAQTVQELFDTGFDAGDLDRYLAMFSPDCEIVALGRTLHGPDQLRGLFEVFTTAFTGHKHVVTSAVEAEDAVAAELTWTATHTGPLVTPGGTIPATGRTVHWDICEIDRFVDGKITTMHIYADQLELMTQLGVGAA